MRSYSIVNLDDIYNGIRTGMNKIESKQDGLYEKVLLVFFDCLLVASYGKINNSLSNEYSLYQTTKERILNTILIQKDINVFQSFFKEKELRDIVNILLPICTEIVSHDEYTFEYNGRLFETLLNTEYQEDEIRNSETRKDEGMFFSDKRLADFICDKVLDEIKKKKRNDITVIDPSLGGGIFIYRFLEQIEKEYGYSKVKKFIENSIYGIDKNAYVVDYFVAFLLINYQDLNIDFRSVRRHFRVADSLLLDLISDKKGWKAVFPEVFDKGGFDYVIGNPPWGKIKPNVREYNLLHGNYSALFQGEALKEAVYQNKNLYKDWNSYKKYISTYSANLKNSSNFDHQRYQVNGVYTGGDADLYKYFLELSYKLLKPNGTLGFIIPASFYMAESATGLRHLFLENGNIKYIINFENKRRIFPIHASYKFIIFIYNKTNMPGKIERAIFNLTDVDCLIKGNSTFETLSYTRTFLKLCSDDYWSVPECSSKKEQELLCKIYKKFPMMGKKIPNLWDICFCREMDMTLDSNKFSEGDKGDNYVPVYEGRMVNQYDSSQKVYVKGTGRQAVWQNNPDKSVVHAHYYIKKELNEHQKYRACYCDITGQTNTRTILASLIRPEAVCGNKVPTCVFQPEDRFFLHLYWIGIANSFVLDWLMRKKITITLNFFHWLQMPFPRLGNESDVAIKIAARSATILEKVNGFDLSKEIKKEGIPELSREYGACKRKSIEKLRIEIELMVAQLFDISIAEYALLLLNFPSIDNGKQGLSGDTRLGTGKATSYVTRDYLLYEYAKMKKVKDINLEHLFEDIDDKAKMSLGETKKLNQRISQYKKMHVSPF